MKVSSNNPIQNSFLKTRLGSWLKILTIGIILEAIFRENFYELGLQIIEHIQYKMNENQLIIQTFKFISFMGTKDFLIIAIILSFNYFDMYSTLIIFEVAGCCSICTGLFKLIYKNPRPFFHEDWVKVYDCETGYGNPSGHSIVVVSTYLTLWKIFKQKFKINPKWKKILFILLCIFISTVLFSRLALGAHSLNQILLGSFIGYQIYSLMFYVLNINLDLENEVKSLVNFKYLNIMTIALISFLLIGFIIFNFFPFSINVDKYLKKIGESCPGTPYSKTLDYEAYFMLSSCSMLLGAYYGIYYDIKVNLKNSLQGWVDINSEQFQWNKTNFSKGLKRLLILIIVLILPFSLTIVVSSHAHTNIIFILKNFVPYFIISFSLFAFVRKSCEMLNCTNKNVNEKQN